MRKAGETALREGAIIYSMNGGGGETTFTKFTAFWALGMEGSQSSLAPVTPGSTEPGRY